MLDLHFPIHGSGSTPEQPRKLRLYLCAIARLRWDRFPGPFRATIDVAERAADLPEFSRSAPAVATLRVAQDFMNFEGDDDDLALWGRRLTDAAIAVPSGGPRPPWTPAEWTALAVLVGLALSPNTPNYRWVATRFHRADLVRDAFEHPDGGVRFDPSWRTPKPCRSAGTCTGPAIFPRCPSWGTGSKRPGATTPTFSATAATARCRTPAAAGSSIT